MFKTRFALAAALLWMAGLISFAFGQPTRVGVEVKHLTEDDLERTAHRLRVSVERLQQARQVLEEATGLTREIEVQQLLRGGHISGYWVRIHRLDAPDRLDALISTRSREVSGLEEASQYRALTQWALQVASELASLHPSRALGAVQAWPAPPGWLGEHANEMYQQLQSGLSKDEFPANFSLDPVSTLRGLLDHSSRLNRFHVQFNRIRHSQDQQEANQLIDTMLTELAEEPASMQTLWQYSSLVRQANTLPHDRTQQLHDSLIAAFQRSSEDSVQGRTYIYEANGRTAELDQGEHLFLQSLRSFYSQPQATLRLVDSWPSLKEKIDRIGGLDRASRASVARVHNAANPDSQSTPVRDHSATKDLIQELKFEAPSRPGLVRQRLGSLSEDGADPFEKLIRIAQMAMQDSPELAHLALEQAALLVEQPENPTDSLARFVQFAHIYADFEGSLTPELIQRGFKLMDLLEEAQSNGSLKSDVMQTGAKGRRSFSRVQGVEPFLIGEWALLDFSAALSDARSREDPLERLKLLTAIIQRLVR